MRTHVESKTFTMLNTFSKKKINLRLKQVELTKAENMMKLFKIGKIENYEQTYDNPNDGESLFSAYLTMEDKLYKVDP
jgi:hypothetical protein